MLSLLKASYKRRLIRALSVTAGTLLVALAAFCITDVTVLIATPAAEAAQETVSGRYCTIQFSDVDVKWARAFADILDAVHDGYEDVFGLSLPPKIILTITVTESPTRLWTDGNNRIYLELESEDDLLPTSRYKNVYGMCHEPGHILMYSRMSSLAGLPDGVAEGWAHYCGSIVCDYVWEKLGAEVYPEPFDYSVHGVSRLREQSATSHLEADLVAACAFFTLGEKHGHDTVGHAMHDALADSPAGAELMPCFVSAIDDITKENASALLPDQMLLSGLRWGTERFARGEKPPEGFFEGLHAEKDGWLRYDDDANESYRSTAGSGHAVIFHTQKGAKLATVALKGARYGLPHSDSVFRLTVLDSGFSPIAQFEFPFMHFKQRGEPLYWREFDTEMTQVPAVFFVSFDFKPTGTDGVYVGIDESSVGHSFYALPYSHLKDFNEGEWMIRVRINK